MTRRRMAQGAQTPAQEVARTPLITGTSIGLRGGTATNTSNTGATKQAGSTIGAG